MDVLLKRIFSLSVLVVFFLQPVIASPIAHPLVAGSAVSLKALDAQHVFLSFYAYRKIGIAVSEGSEINRDRLELPHMAIRYGEEGQNSVALFHPVKPYRTVDGVERFLVMVEIVGLEDDGSMKYCHGCASDVELFAFKREGGGYKLISSTEAGTVFGGAYGTTAIDLNELRIQQIGSNTMGFLYETGFTNQGVTETTLMLVALHEDKPIKVVTVTGDDGYSFDNSGMYGEDALESYAYDGQYRLIPSSGELYSIAIDCTGSKPDANGKVQPYNQTEIYRYLSDKGIYIKQ
ncbi:MAG: hypothetical protein J5492_00515 [Oxalobacter sp.]|nr:hypothetical protein [Oxalobacter sp.]